MQQFYQTSIISNIESLRSAECDEAEQLVVVEWRVPKGAKVPAPGHSTAVARMGVRHASATSKAAMLLNTQLQVSHTLMGARWRTTATLPAPPRPHLQP